jgi:uncharacterized membrane-anchored protein
MSRVWVVVGVVCGVVAVAAAQPSPEVEAETEAPLSEDDIPPFKEGPALIDLGDGVEIDLPAGMVLLERAEARAELAKRADYADAALALVGSPDAAWEVVIELADVGHVSDDDADQLDAGELLTSLEQGTREQNKVRVSKGVSELYIDGWSARPAYDRVNRVLSWGVRGHDVDGQVINEFTNVLGRHGYVSINLIAAPAAMEQARLEAGPALRGVRFQAGHRYQDFDPAVDRSSGLGLRSLIVGGSAVAVATKTGFIAKLLLLLKKAIIVIAVAVAGFFKWITGRRRKQT